MKSKVEFIIGRELSKAVYCPFSIEIYNTFNPWLNTVLRLITKGKLLKNTTHHTSVATDRFASSYQTH